MTMLTVKIDADGDLARFDQHEPTVPPCFETIATAAELKAAYAEKGMVVCSRDDIHAITQEAHTQGRLYTGGGEKLNPADEYERLHDFVDKWINRVLAKEAP